ncbi:MAG: hypothetical protein ED859_11720 [Desulfuromonadales bacterium]|nr:MAG: hypothetical protein ED859_11720 [Desulfuromonadales bacterium]
MPRLNEHLDTLRWHRITAVLENIRTVPGYRTPGGAVIQAMVKEINLALGENEEAPIFFHIRGKQYNVEARRGDRFVLDVLICRRDVVFADTWRRAFIDYLRNPITGRNFSISRVGPVEERSYELLASETGHLPTEGELWLRFLTPLAFNPENGAQHSITPAQLIKGLESRFGRLVAENLHYEQGDDDFRFITDHWRFLGYPRPSRSQPGARQDIKGCVGMLGIAGKFGNLLPWLILASELHAGGKITHARGYFTFARRGQPWDIPSEEEAVC